MKKLILAIISFICLNSAQAQIFMPPPIFPDSSFLPLFFEKRFQHPYLDDYVNKAKEFNVDDYKEYIRKKRLFKEIEDNRCNRTYIDDSITSKGEPNNFFISSYSYLYYYFGLFDDRILDINTMMLDVMEARNLQKFDTLINDVKITKRYSPCCRTCLQFNDTVIYSTYNFGIQSKVEVLAYMHAAILNPDTVFLKDTIHIPKYSLNKTGQPILLALVRIHDIASKYLTPIRIGDTILISIYDLYNVQSVSGYVAMWNPENPVNGREKQYWATGPSSAHFNQKQLELNRFYSAVMDVNVTGDLEERYNISRASRIQPSIAQHTFRVIHCRGMMPFEEDYLYKRQTENNKLIHNKIFKQLFDEN